MIDPSLLELGVATVILILLLDRVFAFVKTQTAKNGKGPALHSCPYTQQDKVRMEAMAIQIEQIHQSINVSKELETAINSLVNQNRRQVKILETLTDISAQTLAVLNKLANHEQ